MAGRPAQQKASTYYSRMLTALHGDLDAARDRGAKAYELAQVYRELRAIRVALDEARAAEAPPEEPPTLDEVMELIEDALPGLPDTLVEQVHALCCERLGLPLRLAGDE